VKSVGATARKYHSVLFKLHDWLTSQHKQPLMSDIEKQYSSLKQQAGVLKFPLCVLNNQRAWKMLFTETARLLQMPALQSSWSVAQFELVTRVFGQLLALDSQMRKEPMPSLPSAAGFDIDAVYPAVAKLHCLKSTISAQLVLLSDCWFRCRCRDQHAA